MKEIDIKDTKYKKNFTIKDKSDEQKYCRHNQILVDLEARAIQCENCQTYLDPFDVLYNEAMKESNLCESLNYYNKEISKAQHKLAALQKKLFEHR